MHASLGSLEFTPKRQLDRFGQFCRDHACDQFVFSYTADLVGLCFTTFHTTGNRNVYSVDELQIYSFTLTVFLHYLVNYNVKQHILKSITTRTDTQTDHVRYSSLVHRHRRNHHTGPVGRVPPNFGDHGDQEYLVPSNFRSWLSFFPGHRGKLVQCFHRHPSRI